MQITRKIQNILLLINITLAILWFYQGLVPEILYHAIEEQKFWEYIGVDEISMLFLIQISGYIEILYGIVFLVFGKFKILHFLNIFGLIGLAITVAIIYPQYFTSGFNPFTMNLSMAVLSVVAIQLINIQKNEDITS